MAGFTQGSPDGFHVSPPPRYNGVAGIATEGGGGGMPRGGNAADDDGVGDNDDGKAAAIWLFSYRQSTADTRDALVVSLE